MLAGNKLIRSRVVGAAAAACGQWRPSEKNILQFIAFFFFKERILLFKKFLALLKCTFCYFLAFLSLLPVYYVVFFFLYYFRVFGFFVFPLCFNIVIIIFSSFFSFFREDLFY